MDAVCKYLKTMTWEGFPLDIVKIKLDHIVAEVVYLVSNAPDDAPTNVSNDVLNNQLAPTQHVNLVINNPKKSQPSHASKDECENVETSCINKPAPVKAKKTKEKPTKLVDLLDGKLLKDDKENSEDMSYKSPRQQRQLSEESTESYTTGDDGLDIVENSPVQNRKHKVVISSDESREDGPKPPSLKHQDQKKKKQKKKKKAKSALTSSKGSEIHVVDDLETLEEDMPGRTTNRWGPVNSNRKQFNDPIPVTIKGQK
ncbi:hypothetical protein L208DRAFT_1374684 [Tricholoma matsutake]|nr:hypothetical protein L208DRAFT_1374684 [Tricholoma matsutake 945]